ncbi:hypothetical protein [Lunatimonas salinarum]|uniref:hypothetical protein n=1 Tax=Lunatimonas salinarum TaxID=1774590 RepID=UPI001ADF7CB4|nr:hypothetical protein [Lunatimonas salinarum]
MDINDLKRHDGNPMMTWKGYGFVLLWLEPYIKDLSKDAFVHFIAGIKLNGLSDEMKDSIRERRKKFPHMMPIDFGALLNVTFDCIIENNLDDFKRLGYKLTHDEVRL